MSITFKKIIVSMAICSLMIYPGHIFGQSTTTSKVVITDVPISVIIETTQSTLSSRATTSSVTINTQQTTNNQNTTPGNILESTLNPQTESIATTTPGGNKESTKDKKKDNTESIATTTPEGNKEPAPDKKIDNEEAGKVTPDPEPITPKVEEEPEVLAVLGPENFNPKPQFKFRLAELKLPAKKALKHNADKVPVEKNKTDKKVNNDNVTTEVVVNTDNDRGVIEVSGACNDKYYVVLLYKNANDYDTNPGSYIVNRAYPCISGSYLYAIDKLPQQLADGTYYLLIAEMGEKGSWVPISSIRPIEINRN